MPSNPTLPEGYTCFEHEACRRPESIPASGSRGWLTPSEAEVVAAAEFSRWLTAHDAVMEAAVAAMAWDEGARSRQCHCAAFSEGECACGNYPSERNPYRDGADHDE